MCGCYRENKSGLTDLDHQNPIQGPVSQDSKDLGIEDGVISGWAWVNNDTYKGNSAEKKSQLDVYLR
jgi:hypothetical protein